MHILPQKIHGWKFHAWSCVQPYYKWTFMEPKITHGAKFSFLCMEISFLCMKFSFSRMKICYSYAWKFHATIFFMHELFCTGYEGYMTRFLRGVGDFSVSVFLCVYAFLSCEVTSETRWQGSLKHGCVVRSISHCFYKYPSCFQSD